MKDFIKTIIVKYPNGKKIRRDIYQTEKGMHCEDTVIFTPKCEAVKYTHKDFIKTLMVKYPNGKKIRRDIYQTEKGMHCEDTVIA